MFEFPSVNFQEERCDLRRNSFFNSVSEVSSLRDIYHVFVLITSSIVRLLMLCGLTKETAAEVTSL